MAPATKAMKKAVGATGLTVSAAFTKVAETAELKPKAAKIVVTKNGKLGGVLNMKLKKKPAKAARKGVNPFTKEPRVFKAKPANKTGRVLPMKKFKEMVSSFIFSKWLQP